MPLQATSGAASYDAFGGGVAAVPNYIEDVFSTYLYAGNDSTQTITNNIDISTKGALVWVKGRSGTYGTFDHTLITTPVSNTTALSSNTTGDSFGLGASAFSPTTTGFNLNTASAALNNNGTNYASWTFRKAPKFFDVVTYTGNGVDGRDISHSLGSSPGFVVIKCTSSSTYWVAKHKDALSLTLNTTNAQGGSVNTTNGYVSSVSSTSFNVVAGLTDLAAVNASGQTYVAYLFAHNAGGFGLTGTDNVISCGSFTGSASGTTVNLGWEPQWVLIKRSSGNTDNWRIYDNMRGMTASNGGQLLYADTSGSETTNSRISVNATGFGFVDDAAYGNIYIAIRRGPMKVPTSGTSVFSPVAYSGNNSSTRQLTSGFPIDLIIGGDRSSPPSNVFDRLRGVSSASPVSYTASTADEQSSVYGILGMTYLQTGDGTVRYQNSAGTDYIDYFFRRAPSYLDEICYTGTGTSGLVLSHNLTVVPEFIIVKERTNDGIANWSACYNFTSTTYVRDILNRVDSVPAVDNYGSGGNNYAAAPTATTITVGTSLTNANGSTYVAYLFATCAGVSKVGNFTGNGSTQTINCGFTGGARFVMVKATSTTGNWIVADSARGIVAGNDPALYLNSTAAEVTGLDWIDADNSGFVVNETATIAANTNGVSYIFFAVA